MNFIFMILLVLLILLLFNIYIDNIQSYYYTIPLIFILVINDLYFYNININNSLLSIIYRNINFFYYKNKDH